MTATPAALTAAPPQFALRMGLFFAGYFALNGVAIPFFPVWLSSRGFSEVEIANIIAIPILARVVLTPFGGAVADRAPSRRFAASLFLLPASFAFLAAWWQTGYWPTLVLTGAAFGLWQLALPAGEALALTGHRRFGLDYGRMRLWGSVAYISINVASGALFGYVPRDAIFWSILVGFYVALAVGLNLPRTPAAVRAADDAARPEKVSARLVLLRPAFLLLTLVAGLISASHGIFYSLGSIFLQRLGYSTFEIGGLWAVSLCCEILFFILSARIHKRIGPFAMIALAAVGAIVRWSIFAFTDSTIGFVIAQSLHAFTFAAVFLGTQFAVVRTVPEQYAASAQGMVAMVGGLLLAGSTALGGVLLTAYGAHAFLAMTVPPLLALLILPFARKLASGEASARPGV